MSAFDPYDDRPRRSHREHDRRDDREPRYVETQETYVRSPVAVAPDPPYIPRPGEIIRRPVREDSDLSIEEVRRDFPPPGSGVYGQQRGMVRDDRYGPPVRSRSAERGSQYGAYLRDPRHSDRDFDDRRSRKGAVYAEQEIIEKPRRRSLSRNQKIIAAVGGAALAVGGKELWDRKQADGRPVSRNALATAAVGAAGAFAGYEGAEFVAKHTDAGKLKEKKKTYVAHQGRNGEVAEYYSSDEETVKPKKSRRKSIVEGALGLAGLGAAAKAAGGGSSRDGRHSSRRGSDDDHDDDRRSRSHGRSKEPEGAAKFQQAAKAALLAGATEAFRVRNEPGGWAGDKGKRIITAAIGAGGIDAAADHNPDKHSKRHILEAVVGGLAGNRLINGSRNNIEDERGSTRGSRSRSRSRGPGGSGGAGPLAALATAGIGALAGKKLLDRSRSQSRSRAGSRGPSRRRRDSSDSYDSRSPSPRRGGKDRHKRSKSVTDYARNGLAALGIGEAVKGSDRNRSRDRGDVEYEETRVHRSSRGDRDRGDRNRGGSDDGYERGSRRSRRSGDYAQSRGDPYGDPRNAESQSSAVGSRAGGGRRSARQKDGQRNRRIAEGKGSESDSSLGSSSGDEKRIKKMKGKQLLTAGLATVATIHAAHNVYQSMEKRNARHKAVMEGEMTPEEARKLKAKATLQDAASVGIAVLGIKGAYSEVKEANEMRHECKEFREKKEERHKKRLQRQKSSHGNSENSSSSGRRRGNNFSSYGGRDGYGPRYIDDNPYSTALPAPPVGYSGR